MRDSFAINDDNYTQCTAYCPAFTVSFSQPSIFPPECQKDENIYDNALACSIEYRINYDTQQINIILQASNDTNMFEGQTQREYLNQVINFDLKKISNIPTELTRKYVCNTKKDCARDFYLGTIDYLLKELKAKLDRIKNKLHNETLIVGENSQRRCHKSVNPGIRPSKPCKHGFCYVNYTHKSEGDSSHLQKCDKATLPFLRSSIEYYAPRSPEKEKTSLEYRCNKHVCNRDDMVTIIQGIINELTAWHPSVTEPAPVIEKKSNSSTKQTIASCIVVLFFFLIQSLI